MGCKKQPFCNSIKTSGINSDREKEKSVSTSLCLPSIFFLLLYKSVFVNLVVKFDKNQLHLYPAYSRVGRDMKILMNNNSFP